MVDVVTCCLHADLRLKSVGLVQRSAAVWRCSAFIAWSGWTIGLTLSHNDSTTNVTHSLFWYYYYYYYYYYYRAMHYSAKCGIAIACRPSVRLSVRLPVCDAGGSGSHRWKFWKLIAPTISPTSSLFVTQRLPTYSQTNMHGEILGRLEVGWEKSGVLEHKSGNISETRKDRGKVTMGSL